MTDLASLVVKLEAQTAQFNSELEKTNRKIDKFAKDTDRSLGSFGKSFGKLGGMVRGGLAGLVAAFSLGSIIRATEEAEQSFALLDNAVKQSGMAAGFTTNQLVGMAEQIQKTTIYSDDAVMAMQQLLLRFRSIQGVNFTRAQEGIVNLATVMKTDLNSAALLVGKALENPIKGANQLARSGVILSDSQKALIKDLVETGKKAEAQAIILGALEKGYGGAAKAARETFGGALAGLKNAFGDLLEGKSGVNDAAKAINRFTEILQDPKTKTAVDGLVGTVFKLAGAAFEAAAGIITLADNLTAVITGDAIGKLKEQIDFLERMQGKSFVAVGYEDIGTGFFTAAEGAAKLSELQQKLIEEQAVLAEMNRPRGPQGRGPGVKPAGLPEEESEEATEANKKATDELAKSIENARKKMLDMGVTMRQQVATFGLSDSAALQYRLTFGDLADEMKLLGPEAEAVTAELILQSQALEALNDNTTLQGWSIDAMELKGNLQEAAEAAFDLQNALLRERLTQRGDEEGLKKLEARRLLVSTQGAYNAQLEEARRITEELNLAEDRITNSRELGAITELDALEQIGVEREKAVTQLEKIYAKMLAIAEASDDPRLKEGVKKFGEELKTLEGQVDLMSQRVAKDMQDAFADAFEGLITGSMNAREALDSFFDSIVKKTANFVAEDIASKIFGGGKTGGGGGGGGGWVSTAINAAMAFFGGGRAGGGPVEAGKAYRVNEQTTRSEYFIPGMNGRIVPAGMGKGATTNNFNFAIRAEGGRISRTTEQQIAAATMRAISQANARGS